MSSAQPITDVVILCWATPSSAEDNARKIADFLGAHATVASLASTRDLNAMRQAVPTCSALIVHVDTLCELAAALDDGVKAFLSVLDLASHVFIYGFQSTERHASALSALSSGSLVRVESLPEMDSTLTVSNDRESCGQLSGVSVQGVDRNTDASFVEGAPRDAQSVLIRAAGRPFFIRIDRGRSKLFLVACSEFANLDEKASSKEGLLPWFSRIVPLMIFLRASLGNRLWHSDRPQACFIIDDPLLKQRYGFLKYAELLEAIAGQKFFACIGFIPWNYRRSRKRIAQMFSTANSPLSLCIHGCDHTRGEFASASYKVLRDKARLALERMRAHRELSGLRFDDVMVFPQGLFSSTAIKALRDSGYLAAVNTDPCASNSPLELTLRELMDVSVTRSEGFPLFVRHYPRDIAEFAFDLFLGKPALAVEHHGYFRNGCEDLATFVRQLNSLDQKLEWSNLTTVCSRACVKKVMPGGEVHVRFYTNRFRLANDGIQPETYVLFRRWPPDAPLPRVALNGRPCVRERLGGELTMSVSLDPGQGADITILPEVAEEVSAVSWKPTRSYRTKVLIRRILSEFRDNYVETNKLMSALLSEARKVKGGKRASPASLSEAAN